MIPFSAAIAAKRRLAKAFAALLAIASLEAAAQIATPDQAIVAPPKSTATAPGHAHPDDEDLKSQTLAPVDITASRTSDSSQSASRLGEQGLAAQRGATSDSARLLQDIPGVSLYGAGGISSLPAIHGMADDRLRVQVDGMDLMSACSNHMNSVLSYINPTSVGSVAVFAGITPVSVGGDSIGGTIQVKSTPPVFANAEEKHISKGQLGAFSRTNGNAYGHNFGATLAGQNVSVSYSESSAKSDNHTAPHDFKASGLAASDRGWLDGNVVGSTAYNSTNRDIGLALRYEDHLFQLNVGEQKVGFEGFPNQRMDMTANTNMNINLRYTGQFEWGELETRIYDQTSRHEMDLGPERESYGTGMPMRTKAKTRGAQIKGSIELTEQNTLKVGSEYQSYRLHDWWPAVGDPGTSMCCKPYLNVNNGERDRLGVFGEWEARWNPAWLTLLGVRADTVTANAGAAQGYNASYTTEEKKFNALDHRRTDHNRDWTALARFTPDTMQTYEAGFARKSRSPNLYERYPWSGGSMTAVMNNFVGDGNGYIGNPDLKPEVAHTVSGTADWHADDKKTWGLKATGYLTNVSDYIDAKRCTSSISIRCTPQNLTTTNEFVILQYANQSARLHGFDISAHALLGRSDDFGSLTVTGALNYVRGENRSTGDNLYHMMPRNKKFALVHRLSSWTTTAEVQRVDDKTYVSRVRNETPTAAYSLFNLRASYELKYARIDIGVENVFNRFYELPLGGAYTGQGDTMMTNNIPWGVNIPGMGRSINAALNMHF